MMWDEVMTRVLAHIEADAVLTTIYSGAIRMAGTGKRITPVLEWSLIGDTESELWAPMIVQFDQFTFSAEATRKSEYRLRAMFQRNLQIVIGGDMRIWTQYEDGDMLVTPDRSGIVGRASRFRFTPLRRQYAMPAFGLPIEDIGQGGGGLIIDGGIP